MKTLAIHATNINGIGAIQVVNSLLNPLIANLQDYDVQCFLSPLVNKIVSVSHAKVTTVHRKMPNSISRFIEVEFPPLLLRDMNKVLVLGDIPLRGVNEQVVLVHQSHLVGPDITEGSSRDIKFKVMRRLFRNNSRYVKRFVVQTGVMKQGLMKTYDLTDEKIVVIPLPPPSWMGVETKQHFSAKQGLKLFYPAAAYPHKNHALLERMNAYVGEMDFPIEVVITVDAAEMPPSLAEYSWIKCVGRLHPKECLGFYRSCDGLFFPSLLESYGLPLVEAMTLGLPVVCADRPYARWMCETEAVYFDPLDGQAASQAVVDLSESLHRGWYPKWEGVLQKLPDNWDQAAQAYRNIL